MRNVFDRTLGPRGTLLAFSHGDIFASLLGCYLTGGDCIEDVMDIKPFWDGNTNVKFHQKDTLERIFGRLESEARVLVRKIAEKGTRAGHPYVELHGSLVAAVPWHV